MDCVHPRTIKDPKHNTWMQVSCGMCIACRIAKVREWKLRIMMEQKMWDKSGFLTLTYDDVHLPITPCGHPTLRPDHLSTFWKSVRMRMHRDKMKEDPEYARLYNAYRDGKLESPPPLLKYFSVGEYGDQTKRPHYHAAVFGIGLEEFERYVRPLWKYGSRISLDGLTPQSAGYIVGYVQKKIYKDPIKYFREYGCCVWPFQRISQGIGLKYYETFKDDYWINLRPTVNGVSYSTPRYFTRKDDNLKFAISLISARVNKLNLERQQKALENGVDLYASMSQREIDLKARSRLKKKGNL